MGSGSVVFRIGLGALLVVSFGALEASAQEPKALQLTSVGGEVGGSLDASWLTWDPVGGQRARSWREWTQLSITGYSLHPSLLSFAVTARPSFVQGGYLMRGDSISSSGAGDALTGNVRLDLFRDSQINGHLKFGRSDNFQRTPFGGWTRSNSSGWEARVRDTSPLLPATLTVSAESRDRGWLTGAAGRVFRLDTSNRAIRYRAQNSKTMLRLERVRYGLGASGDSYVRRLGAARHVLKWGKGSILRSNVRYADREDTRLIRSLSWSEAVSLRQSHRVLTELNSALLRAWAPESSSGQVDLGLSTRVELGRLGGVGFDGLLRRWDAGAVRQDVKQVGPAANVAFDLPGGFRLASQLDARYEHRGQASEVGLSYAQVVQETHVAGTAGFFRLNRAYVDPGSVVVTDPASGLRFEEFLDYQIIENAPFLEIHILPGGRIADRDELAVDYRYQAVPTVSAHGFTLGYRLDLQFRRFTVSARRRRQRDLGEPVATSIPVLTNYDRSSLSATAEVPWRVFTLNVTAQRSHSRVEQQGGRSTQLRAGLATRWTGSISSSSSLRWHRTEGGIQPYATRSLNHRMTFRLGSGLSAHGTLSRWTWHDASQHQAFSGASATLDWVRRRDMVTLSYGWRGWLTVGRWDEHQLLLQVRRTF